MFFSPAELAAQLNVSVNLIYQAIRSGALHASNIGGQQRPTYRVTLESRDAWLEERKCRPDSVARRRKRRPQTQGVTEFFS